MEKKILDIEPLTFTEDGLLHGGFVSIDSEEVELSGVYNGNCATASSTINGNCGCTCSKEVKVE